jgi:hypothetical protein
VLDDDAAEDANVKFNGIRVVPHREGRSWGSTDLRGCPHSVRKSGVICWHVHRLDPRSGIVLRAIPSIFKMSIVLTLPLILGG